MPIVRSFTRIHAGSQGHALRRRYSACFLRQQLSAHTQTRGVGGLHPTSSESRRRQPTNGAGGSAESWPQMVAISAVSAAFTVYCLAKTPLLAQGPDSSGGDDDARPRAEGRDGDRAQVGLIQSLYNSITTGAVGGSSSAQEPRNTGDNGGTDPEASRVSPRPASPEQPSETLWHTELMNILEMLGAAPAPSNAATSRPESLASPENPVAERDADYMAWLVSAKGRLDGLASQVQHLDWSAFTGFTAEESEQPVTAELAEQPADSAQDIAKASSFKDRILRQLSAVQAQLNQQIDETTAALGHAVQNMLPPQLQRPWVAECAQLCIDRKTHPELLKTTSVRVSTDICGQEVDFQQVRAKSIRDNFAKFIGVSAESVDVRDIPVIGIAGSGGGFRAMIATLGSYRAMHQAGLAQCVTYDAAVSGSSWAIAALHTYADGNPCKALESVHEAMKSSMFSTSNLTEFVNEHDRIAKHVFANIAARYLLSAAKIDDAPADAAELQPGNAPEQATLADRILGVAATQGYRAIDALVPEKYRSWLDTGRPAPAPVSVDELLETAKNTLRSVSVPPLSIVDLYGALLFRKLLVQHTKTDGGKPELHLDPQWVKLSAQRAAVDQGRLPMPIYTAVRHFIGTDDNDPDKEQSHAYQWFEFNPYEVGSIDHGAWIPSWAFGRPMVNGREQFKIGEAHFGSIIGAASSAFCASVKAMVMEIYMAVPSVVRTAMDPLLDRIEHGSEIAHPIPPYTLYNPFYRTEAASDGVGLAELGNKPFLSLMDAGMENNLPFAPLLRPERGVDVIVCLDASANIEIMPWFARAEAWAGDHGAERWPWGARPWAADPLRPSKAEVTLDQSTLSGTRSVRESMNRRIHEDNIRCVVFDQPVASSPLPKKGSVPRPMTLLYLPLLPNSKFRDPKFDPETADFCGTFNDQWTSDQIDLLADLASFNLTQEIERIREAMTVAYKRKRAHRLFQEGLHR